MGLLIFLPYILVPLLIALLFKLLKVSTTFTWLTFLLTVIIIFFYPNILFRIDNYLHPQIKDTPKCLMPELGLVVGNLFILLPLSIGLQTLFNYMFGIIYKGKKTENI